MFKKSILALKTIYRKNFVYNSTILEIPRTSFLEKCRLHCNCDDPRLALITHIGIAVVSRSSYNFLSYSFPTQRETNYILIKPWSQNVAPFSNFAFPSPFHSFVATFISRQGENEQRVAWHSGRRLAYI